MKQKKLLTALVLLSISSSGYIAEAADYNNESNVIGKDIVYENMIVNKNSPENIYIGDENTQSITIGNENIKKYKSAIEINDPITSGVSAHNVNLKGESIIIKAGEGRGVSIGSSYESGESSLNIQGKTFVYEGNGNGGINSAHGSFFAGEKSNWMESFTIQGGKLNIGIQPGDTVKNYIYTHSLNIENNENGRGCAFENSGYTEINADNINLTGSFDKANSSTGYSGVLVVGRESNSILNANNIIIKSQKVSGKANEYLYAIKTNLGSRDKAYVLNLNAKENLNVEGNILLDGNGTAKFNSNNITINGLMHGKENVNASEHLGSAITINNGSKLEIGSKEKNVQNVNISSQGKYGILLGGPYDTQNKNENGKLDAYVQGEFNIIAENGTGVATLRDMSEANINAGTININAKENGIHTNIGTINMQGNKGINIQADKSGIYANGINSADRVGKIDLVSKTGKILINAKETAIEAYVNSTVDVQAEDIILKSQNKNSKATVYAEGVKQARSQFIPKINLSARNGIVAISSEKTAVQAIDGGLVNINGAVQVNADNKNNTKSLIALSASGKSFDKKNKSTINVNLQGDKDSYIVGNIVADSKGIVNIKQQDYTGKLSINGNISANSGGQVNITPGENTILNSDLEAKENGTINIKLVNSEIEANANNHVLYRPFLEKGSINLDLTNSIWFSRSESSIDTLNLNNSTVDLTKDEAAFVMVDKLNGDGTFNMTLNSVDHKKGDMLYIGTNNGHQTVNIVGGITGGWENISEENPLRFATVAKENGDFQNVQAYTKDAGVWNLEYVVKKEKFDKKDAENEEYNGQGNGGSSHEIGNDFVENKLVGNNTNAQNWVITGVKAPTDNNGGNNQENNNSGTQISDAGKTILAMSKVNYANAVYMDRLNKRMGEANYIDGDDGLWLRIRHDRIGKENAFRSKNTMFEVGYDNKVNNKENHHQGIAFDYMRGSADYSNVIGSGNVHRAGVWLYDTQYDEQGAYTDFVIKAGKLTNDFDLLAKTTGENIHGEYDNMVYALSAEYGKKIAWKNDWYIEPQAQLQYAHVTGAEYTTSQGTQVSLDGIDSLIARAGLKIGKDINQKDNIYFKADVLHEFLGDQDISAGDKTGRLYQKYDNKGTWYDLGFGFTHRFDENTYMYADVEQSFGNDNEDTYQFNLGLNVKF